jgi:hypothetical protein
MHLNCALILTLPAPSRSDIRDSLTQAENAVEQRDQLPGQEDECEEVAWVNEGIEIEYMQ